MNAWRHYREGAVKVRLQGLSPERFFNLCGQGEVEIWKISCMLYDCQGIFLLPPLCEEVRCEAQNP